MTLNEAFKEKIIRLYCIVALVIIIYKFFTHHFLFQLVPSFFFNSLDFTTWLIHSTKIHKSLLDNKINCLIADACFYLLPFVYYISYKKNKALALVVGWTMVFVNLSYFLIYCSFPTDSLHVHIASFLFPFLFTANNLLNYWFVFQGLRYFFLFYFFSAGVWKFVQEGIFHLDQMSVILISQHKEILASVSYSWEASLYRWLIDHSGFGYLLYLLATVLELSFIVGFFTKRFDYLLIGFYITFLIMDLLVMRINYWETIPFIFTLFYSRIKDPDRISSTRLIVNYA